MMLITKEIFYKTGIQSDICNMHIRDVELKNISIQEGKGVKGPSEQIFILFGMFYHVIDCDLKISFKRYILL